MAEARAQPRPRGRRVRRSSHLVVDAHDEILDVALRCWDRWEQRGPWVTSGASGVREKGGVRRHGLPPCPRTRPWTWTHLAPAVLCVRISIEWDSRCCCPPMASGAARLWRGPRADRGHPRKTERSSLRVGLCRPASLLRAGAPCAARRASQAGECPLPVRAGPRGALPCPL